MNRSGGTDYFAFPVPPNDPQPFGIFAGQTNWQISSPTGNLSTPNHGLSSQYLTATFATVSTLRVLSNTITNFTATDLTVNRAITFSNASSFIAESTFIQNTGGRILNPTTVATHRAHTSTISTQSISTYGATGRLQISAASTLQMTRANISTGSANVSLTSSLTLTNATLGAPFTYSTITPAATWLLPSTFQLQTPPFQFTEGEGTYFNKVFFTAAQDCVAYYSIIDPRSETPATLSTLHVNTVAGTGTAGATGQAIGNVYGPAIMDSTFATYFGDNFGVWRLRRLGPDGSLSTMGGRSRFYYGDNGPATNAVLGPKTYVALNSTDSVIVTDLSNVRIRRAFFDGTFNTIAGNGIEGYTGDGGLALAATLYNPATTATDSSGTVYIADASNNVIRAILNSTMTTYAGTGFSGGSGDGGPAINATFSEPFGVALDLSNNLYIADTNNHVVRKIDAATSTITLIAGTYIAGFSGDGGPATAAQLYSPKSVAVDVSSNIYILDAGNVRIRRIDALTGDINTIAGDGTNGYAGDDGPATTAVFNDPLGITTDSENNVYIADTGNHIVRQILTGTGIIYRFAGVATAPGFTGDGSFATFARLNTPTTVACDPVSQKLYIADQGNFRVRVVDIPTNIINTAVGNGSPATGGDNVPVSEAVFGSIFGLARDSQQNIYLADGYGQTIRKIDPSTFIITTVGGSGVAGFSGDGGSALTAEISTPVNIFIDNANRIFFTDSENHRVRRIDPASGLITTVAGTGNPGYNGDFIDATTADLYYPRALAGDAAGNLYIGDTSNFRIRRVTPAGTITTVAGTGFAGTVIEGLPAIVSPIDVVTGVALDTSTNLYFTDLGTSAAWKVRAATGILEPFTAAGPGYLNDAAPISTAIFAYPSAISFDACGNFVIADRANYRLRRTYGYGPPRLPNYLNLDFRYTNYQNTNGNTYIALNGNLLATFDAVSLSDFTYAMTDSNILSYPLQSSNPVLGDQTPWLEIGQANSTGYIQLEGLAWANQSPGEGLQSNFVNSDAGIIVNRGILRFPNRVNGITLDNKFNDASTRSISYTGSLFASSDPRLKENICPADPAICVSSFTALPLKRFAYKAGTLPVQDKHRLGYLTTDIAAVFPKSIVPNTSPDLPALSSFNTVDYTQLKFAHLATTQHLLREVDRLEGLVSRLRARRAGVQPTQRTCIS
jgi:sugar lactone lactonase YvrE